MACCPSQVSGSSLHPEKGKEKKEKGRRGEEPESEIGWAMMDMKIVDRTKMGKIETKEK